MCAICGTFSWAGVPVDPGGLRRMVGAMRHRGPDEEGVYVDRHVGLGHARLSILDLAGGAQPMHSRDGSLSITFNGEIFNHIELRDELRAKGHRFETSSDTEVILHLYREEGEQCVQRLNGQWAFALWDANAQKLFLSRDRLGVRPLFYTRTADSFFFASEIKALLPCPGVSRELDLQGMNQVFTFWFTVAPRTAFRGICQLPPGHSLVIQHDQVRVWQYWQLGLAPHADASDGRERHLADRLLELLQDATDIRLRSDVPVASYLSGGLDSSVTTALARQRLGDRLSTFSVTFDDPEFDESANQQCASEFLRTDHHDVRCSPRDIAEVFSEVIWHSEQPILRTAPAAMFLLSRFVRNNGFKVVLTGEGADEILGGYDIFKEAKIRRFWGRQLHSGARPQLLRRLYPYMGDVQKQPLPYLSKFFRVNAGDLASPFFSHLPRWELTSKLRLFLTDGVQDELQRDQPVAELEQTLPPDFAAWPPFAQVEYLEAAYLLPGYILSSQGDRMAMAHSVEGRHPFLDHRVVEFGATLPPQLKMKVLNEKYLLKRAVAGLIPDSVRTRHKQPYRAPGGRSFFSFRSEYVDEILSPARVRRNGIFNPDAVGRLVHKFRSGRLTGAKDDMAMVGILSTEMLLDRFVNIHDSVGPAPEPGAASWRNRHEYAH